MRLVVFLVGPLATLALVLALGWPVLLAGFALAFGTLLFSMASVESGEPSEAAVPSDAASAPDTVSGIA